MPKKTLEETKALIDKGEVLAITLDTSIFDKFGCNLEYKSLTAVEQFREKHIDFLLSPVTTGEVRSHISKAINEAAVKATAGINQFLKLTRSTSELDKTITALGLDVDPAEEADDIVNDYIDRVGATIISQQTTSSELLHLYFEVKPPFGKSAEKKAEFPDAIALLSLEKWARENDTLVLAVTRDGDWKAFAEESAEIICIEDLTAALSLFNDQESVVAARVSSAIKAGAASNLASTIDSRLEAYIEDFDADASSAYYYDYEIHGAVVTSWSYENDEAIVVVASDDEEVTISFELAVEAEFEARFSFSVRDSIDRDYVKLGSTIATTRAKFTVSAVASFSKSSDRDPDPTELEIEGRGVTVDFGEVEPDWD